MSSAEVGIGEASRRVGLAPSAIRFYESEGLLDPPTRRNGRRRYGPDEMRILAFIALSRDLGLGLAAVRRALDPKPSGWAAVVDEQITLLEARIAHAQQAREFLLAGRDCPAAQPVRDCPYLGAALDQAYPP